MRRIFFHKAAVIALAMGIVAPGAGVGSVDVAAYQLLFLFDPDSEEQLRRALVLERATAEIDGIELLGMVNSRDIGSPALDRLGFQILSVGDFLQQDQVAAEAAEDWFRSGEPGSLLLLNRNGGGTRTVASDDFEAAIHRLSASLPIPTEVDVTTWGKVKDLFN
jgi:hypothetical protein